MRSSITIPGLLCTCVENSGGTGIITGYSDIRDLQRCVDSASNMPRITVG
ncbi:MAG: hypothetical protein WCK53_03220 [Methanomicrobiales archaeon]